MLGDGGSRGSAAGQTANLHGWTAVTVGGGPGRPAGAAIPTHGGRARATGNRGCQDAGRGPGGRTQAAPSASAQACSATNHPHLAQGQGMCVRGAVLCRIVPKQRFPPTGPHSPPCLPAQTRRRSKCCVCATRDVSTSRRLEGCRPDCWHVAPSAIRHHFLFGGLPGGGDGCGGEVLAVVVREARGTPFSRLQRADSSSAPATLAPPTHFTHTHTHARAPRRRRLLRAAEGRMSCSQGRSVAPPAHSLRADSPGRPAPPHKPVRARRHPCQQRPLPSSTDPASAARPAQGRTTGRGWFLG